LNMNSSKTLSVLGVMSVLFFFLQSQSFAHSWMAPENEAKKKNPIPISDESTKNGHALFMDLCSSCHGLGAVGLSKEKTGLIKDTPNLSNRLKTHSDGDFHWKILNGKTDMPSFKDELSEKEVWDVINYIKILIK
jgi:mono/diheme cytochrome c family protein